MKYKLSVVIPAHNRSNNIKELVTKFLEINDVEIIVIENGSDKKEKTLYKIIEKEYKNQKNVKFFFNTWGSSSKARKEGANKSTGSHIFFCDDDDFPTDEFIDWVNKNTLNDEIYSFDLKTGNNGRLRCPKSFKNKQINKTLQPSVWLIKKEILITIFNNEIFPSNILLGEDQILGLFIFNYAQLNDIELSKGNVKSIIYNHFNSGSFFSKKQVLESDLLINVWLKKQNLHNLENILNKKMVIARLGDNRRGIYKTDSKKNIRRIKSFL